MESINDYAEEEITMEEDPNEKPSSASCVQQEEVKFEFVSSDQPAPSASEVQKEIKVEVDFTDQPASSALIVQEGSIGIFQLIDQLETAVDKLLERQEYFACTLQVGVIKTDFAIQYCSKCHTLPTNLTIQEDNIVYVRNIISCSFSFVSAIV
jgi:hypothetical protein